MRDDDYQHHPEILSADAAGMFWTCRCGRVQYELPEPPKREPEPEQAVEESDR